MDIAWNELRTFDRCPTEHTLYHVRRLQPPAPYERRSFDELVRAGVRAWWSGPLHDPPLLGAARVQHAIAAVVAPGGDAYDLARAIGTVEAYAARWESAELQPIRVGHEVAVELPRRSVEPFVIMFEVDVVARDAAGRTVVLLLKLTSEDLDDASPLWPRIAVDGEPVLAARATAGGQVAVQIDAIQRPRIRPLGATGKRTAPESTIEFRARVRTEMSDLGALARHDVTPTAAIEQARLIEWAALAEDMRLPRRMMVRRSSACRRLSGDCAFLRVCAGLVREDSLQVRPSQDTAPSTEFTSAAA